jgi:hypothetical protein
MGSYPYDEEGAGRERRVAGECELRGEEQFPSELPGIGAGGVGQAAGAQRRDRKFEDVVKSAEEAAVLVVVY